MSAQLVPFTEFEPSSLGTAVRNLAAANQDFLTRQRYLPDAADLGEMTDDEAGQWADRLQQQDGRQMRHFSILDGESDKVIGVARIEMNHSQTNPRYTVHELGTRLGPAAVSRLPVWWQRRVRRRQRIVTTNQFVEAYVDAWVREDRLEELGCAYQGLMEHVRSRNKRLPMRPLFAWTMEPVGSPQEIHDAIGSAALVAQGHDGRFYKQTTGESPPRKAPQSRLYVPEDPPQRPNGPRPPRRSRQPQGDYSLLGGYDDDDPPPGKHVATG